MKLINTERLRKSTSISDLSAKQKIESDRGRVVFSSPLRRMQSKAQVFSLESNAAVRSRLTHSLEVAHIGRYLVQKVRNIADELNISGLVDQCSEIETIVETACLLHDIGNPPFGHLGEAAIKDWFIDTSETLFNKSTMKSNRQENVIFDRESQNYLDFANFDGNPQGLRIVMTLQGKPGECGLNLTYSQLASIVKYPRVSTDKDTPYKKVGVFSTEQEGFYKVWKDLEIPDAERFPLVLLMEAADDIAYSLGDIEDGIEKGIKSENTVLSDLVDVFNRLGQEHKTDLSRFVEFIKDESRNDILKGFVSFRISMINSLVDVAARAFVEKYRKGIFGSASIFEKELQDIGEVGHDLHVHSIAVKEGINKYCRDSFYNSSEAVDIEIAGYNIVHGLMDKFSILLTLSREEFRILVECGKGGDMEKRIFSKLPKRLVEHYVLESNQEDVTEEWYSRVRLIIDYVSGMTDDFALKAYRLFNGIEIDTL